jgi:hypothetical protein
MGILPMLAVGFAYLWAGLETLAIRRPRAMLAAAAAVALCVAVLAQFAAMRQVAAFDLDTSKPSPLGERLARAGRGFGHLVEDAAGDPASLPASLVFAVEHWVHPSRYSCVVGRFFLERGYKKPRQTGQKRLRLWHEDDACFVAEGFSEPRGHGGDGYRSLLSSEGRLLVPMFWPADSVFAFEARGSGECSVQVLLDGRALGSIAPGAEFDRAALEVPAGALRHDVQELELRSTPAGCLDLREIAFLFRNR